MNARLPENINIGMLHVTKFEIKYGLVLCFSIAKNQKLLFACFETKNFCFAGNTYYEWKAKKS